jgi:hypothetical protein
MEATKPNLDTATKVWDEFVEANPCLGYVTGRWSFTHFIRTHSQKLEPDVLYKTHRGHWLADRNRFADAALKILANPVGGDRESC